MYRTKGTGGLGLRQGQGRSVPLQPEQDMGPAGGWGSCSSLGCAGYSGLPSGKHLSLAARWDTGDIGIR